jgi:hypothetical protein
MKKISLVISGVMFVSSSFAHQVSGQFQNSSWNWNNGSHFSQVVSDSVESMIVNSTDVTHSTPTSHTHASGDTHKHVADDAAMSSKKEPMFDTGMKPSNSK